MLHFNVFGWILGGRNLDLAAVVVGVRPLFVDVDIVYHIFNTPFFANQIACLLKPSQAMGWQEVWLQVPAIADDQPCLDHVVHFVK